MAKNKKCYDICKNRILAKTGRDIPSFHTQIVEEADQ